MQQQPPRLCQFYEAEQGAYSDMEEEEDEFDEYETSHQSARTTRTSGSNVQQREIQRMSMKGQGKAPSTTQRSRTSTRLLHLRQGQGQLTILQVRTQGLHHVCHNAELLLVWQRQEQTMTMSTESNLDTTSQSLQEALRQRVNIERCI
eukprot:197746-Amphidinium_carterae.1